MEQTAKTNKMADMPVKKLMLSMGVPIIISMVLQAVYNIVDTAFVGNIEGVGKDACTALTLAFPMQMLIVAISIGTGVGTNALVSKKLGQGDKEQASRVAGNAVFLATIIYIVFLLFGLFGVRFYIDSQGQSETVSNMAINYLSICCIFSTGTAFFAIYEKLLQATGHSLYSTIAQISGAVVNIIMDPIMIYGLLGFPAMGIEGAAYATVIGQMVSWIVAMICHLKVNKDISNDFKYIKPSGKIIKGIYSIGLPAIIAQALMSVMTYGLNIILTPTMVTAYGVYYKVQQFVLFASFGLRDAITPIISFSHGMRNKERIRDGIKCGMLYTFIIMIIGTILVEVLAYPFESMFGLSGTTEGTLFVSAMHIISISFVFSGANIAFQGIFQALNGGVASLVVSVCRQIVFVLPVAWFFMQIANNSQNLEGLVWTTFIIAEFISLLISCVFMIRIDKKENIEIIKKYNKTRKEC